MEFGKKRETQAYMPVEQGKCRNYNHHNKLHKRLAPIICFLRYRQEVWMFHEAERWIRRLRHLGKREVQKLYWRSNIHHLSKFEISRAGRRHKTAQRYSFPCLIKTLDLKMNLKMRLTTMTKQEQEILGQTIQTWIILRSSDSMRSPWQSLDSLKWKDRYKPCNNRHWISKTSWAPKVLWCWEDQIQAEKSCHFWDRKMKLFPSGPWLESSWVRISPKSHCQWFYLNHYPLCRNAATTPTTKKN